MRLAKLYALFVCLSSLLALLGAQGMARMNSVEPATVKAGAEATVSGENLDKNAVTEIYITDGTSDIKLQIVQQSAASIKFRVPAGTKAGRFSMMLLTTGADPKLIEQPVKVNVE